MIKTPLIEMTSYQLFKETGFDVLTAVVTNSAIFWAIMHRSLVKVSRRFGGTRRLDLQV
jgi:hypothetical protein